jgi:hypothetical protein
MIVKYFCYIDPDPLLFKMLLEEIVFLLRSASQRCMWMNVQKAGQMLTPVDGAWGHVRIIVGMISSEHQELWGQVEKKNYG